MGWWRCRSGRPASLECIEHQIAHGTDIGLDPFQPVGIGLAVLGALPVHAVALGHKLPVEPDQHRIIGEGAARDGGEECDEAADQRCDGGGQAIVAEGKGYAFKKGGRHRCYGAT